MSSHDSHPVDPVSERLGHVVAVWRDITLVWGGYRCKYTVSETDAEFYWDPAVVHAHDEGIWSARRTFGDVPPETSGAAAEVIGDFLFVACGMVRGSTERYTNELYKLDLKSLLWTKMSPEGTRPLKSDKMTSWVDGQRMYLFGGYGKPRESGVWYPTSLQFIPEPSLPTTVGGRGWNNQLVFYETESNSWHWPSCSGSVPSPRACHATFFTSGVYKLFDPTNNFKWRDWHAHRHRSLAISFGGRSGIDGKLNDIYVFDSEAAEWLDIEDLGCTPPEETIDVSKYIPRGRSWHSLTKISSKCAVLFGGYDNHSRTLGDCWVLNFYYLLNVDWDVTWDEIWIRCEHHEDTTSSAQSASVDQQICGRLGHHAVKEPNSRRLWIIGGMAGDIAFAYPDRLKHADRVKELTFSSDQRLKVLALESVVMNLERLAPEVQKLPMNLRKLVEAKSRAYRRINSM